MGMTVPAAVIMVMSIPVVLAVYVIEDGVVLVVMRMRVGMRESPVVRVFVRMHEPAVAVRMGVAKHRGHRLRVTGRRGADRRGGAGSLDNAGSSPGCQRSR